MNSGFRVVLQANGEMKPLSSPDPHFSFQRLITRGRYF